MSSVVVYPIKVSQSSRRGYDFWGTATQLERDNTCSKKKMRIPSTTIPLGLSLISIFSVKNILLGNDNLANHNLASRGASKS